MQDLDPDVGIRVFSFLSSVATKEKVSLQRVLDPIGIGYNTLYKYVKGTRAVSSRVLNKLIDMGCDPEWLLGKKAVSNDSPVLKVGDTKKCFGLAPDGSCIPLDLGVGRANKCIGYDKCHFYKSENQFLLGG